MLFDPETIQLMRAALASAERSLHFAFPNGLDRQTREILARSIIAAAAEGQRNPMLLSATALGKLDAKSAA